MGGLLIVAAVAVTAYLLGVWERRTDGLYRTAEQVMDALDEYDLTIGRELEDAHVQTARAMRIARIVTGVEPPVLSRLDELDGLGRAR